MNLKAQTNEELVGWVGVPSSYCDVDGTMPCESEDLRAELLLRLTPQVTGNVGELLDKLEKEMSLIGWSTHDDDPSDLLELVRRAVADLQADRERYRWLIKHGATITDGIHKGKIMYYVRYFRNILAKETDWFDTPNAAIDAAMKEAK